MLISRGILQRLLLLSSLFLSVLNCSEREEDICRSEFISFYLLYNKIDGSKLPYKEKRRVLLRFKEPKCKKLRKLFSNCLLYLNTVIDREGLIEEWKREDLKIYEKLNKIYKKKGIEYKILKDRLIEGLRYNKISKRYGIKEREAEEIVSRGIKDLGIDFIEKIRINKKEILSKIEEKTRLIEKILPSCEREILRFRDEVYR